MKKNRMLIMLIPGALICYGFLNSINSSRSMKPTMICELEFTTDRGPQARGKLKQVNLLGNAIVKPGDPVLLYDQLDEANAQLNTESISFIGSHFESFDWCLKSFLIRNGEFALMDNLGNQLWGYYYGEAKEGGKIYGVVVRGVGKYRDKQGIITLLLSDYTSKQGKFRGTIEIQIEDKKAA